MDLSAISAAAVWSWLTCGAGVCPMPLTLPLGGLRLIDASGGNLKKAREIVDSEFAKVDWLEKGGAVISMRSAGPGGRWRGCI